MKAFNHKQREAVARLYRNNNDFMEFVDYLKSMYEDTKNNLLITDEINFKQTQGKGLLLERLLKDIAASPK